MTHPRRRAARLTVAATTATLLLAAAQSSAAAHDSDDRRDRDRDRDRHHNAPLRSLADRSDLRIGTAVDMDVLADDKTYRKLTARQFNSVTAENVMKWESVEPTRGTYDFEAADDLVTFAKRNGQGVRGHTLVWHNQNPAWLTEGVADGSIDSTELRSILRDHITNQVKHFKGKIYEWDVVNEIFEEDGSLRDTFWLRELGPSYIADAFRWAHAADPRAKLFLNDYNVEGINAKSTAYYDLAKDLRARGVPIHGFGAQGHLDIGYGFPGEVQANLERFDKLGMTTAFTEVDVRMDLPADATKLARQADDYRRLLTACLNVRGCESFTVWGYSDKYSWVPGWFDGQGAANIMDESFQAKPAYDALREELASRTRSCR